MRTTLIILFALSLEACASIVADDTEPATALGDKESCSDIPVEGVCDGATVVWCEGGIHTLDCGSFGAVCGWNDADERFFCAKDNGEVEPDPAPSRGECAAGVHGRCSMGQILIRCDGADEVQTDCLARGRPCGWVNAQVGYACGGWGEKPAGPDIECNGLSSLGACVGNIAAWCDDGQVRTRYCRDDTCGWINEETGYYCGGHGEQPDPMSQPEHDPLPPPEEEDPVAEGCGSADEVAEFELTNEARAMAGLSPLVCDPIAATTARKHSQDMCDQGYFSHQGLDGSLPWDRFRREGGRFRAAGENIAQGYRSPNAVHIGWMNSPGHRANILNGGFGRIGVGLAPCNGRMYWTQVFAD